MAAQARSSVAYTATCVSIVFLIVLLMLYMVVWSFQDAFLGAAIASVALLAAACAVFTDASFRGAALVAGSAFTAVACSVLFSSEPAYQMWRHAVAGIPIVGPALTLWDIFA